jgi:hypothetical protein
MGRWIDGWIDRKDGWMDGRNGWIDRWVDG